MNEDCHLKFGSSVYCAVQSSSYSVIQVSKLVAIEIESRSQTPPSVAITDLQISPIFPRNFSRWDINVRVSEGSSQRALSNGACNAIVGKTVTKPRPPKLSP